MSNSNYDKFPQIQIRHVSEPAVQGWEAIGSHLSTYIRDLKATKKIIVVEAYPGTHDDELLNHFKEITQASLVIDARELYLSEDELDVLTFQDVTEDRIFGFMTRLQIDDFWDTEKLVKARSAINQTQSQTILLIGCGASQISDRIDLFIYADMARWEIQQRMRKGQIANLGTTHYDLEIARKYKRAYFVDWRIADRIKRKTFDQWDFVLDTNSDQPVMVTSRDYKLALEQAVNRPFRVVPFFDPGPWGGQWMKEVCDLDRDQVNYAWCFDCVPEENSVLLNFNGVTMESPALNLVFFKSKELLGERVFARFGAEFPIRFDFLDTMDGGNLSLQVHPITEYIREQFGMFYTQDESYYMLDAGQDALVYLGVKNDVNPEEMIQSLKVAQNGGPDFDADRFVASWPTKKHDHFSIPAGTVHCSAKNCMVLEISATPYIFTFKLWDWGRLGMDGLPRPINIEHGEKVIQWDRNESWVKKELINQFKLVTNEEHCREEITGLHEFEFIETRRHWFRDKVTHYTDGSVNVLNLIEGKEAIVESPDESFEPFIVHFAETFIIPEKVGIYTIRPHGPSVGTLCATIKATVKK